MELNLVHYPDPFLRKRAEEITEFDAGLKELAEAMLDTMYEAQGVGLAAPQVGIGKRIFVLNPTGDREDRAQEMVLINPEVKTGKPREWGEEGCLSIPGIHGEVERHHRAVTRFRDLDGKEQLVEAEGFLARIIQHELDHLDGRLFIDRLSPTDRMRTRAGIERLEARYEAAQGGEST